MQTTDLVINGESHEVSIATNSDGHVVARVDDRSYELNLREMPDGFHLLELDGIIYRACVAREGDSIHVWINGRTFTRSESDGNAPGSQAVGHDSESSNLIGAPMPGKILKLLVNEGDKVTRGAQLFIVEAMKMENEVKAHRDGTIKRVLFSVDDLVSVGETVIELEEE